jgi:RNA-directed DNA polymerase
MKNINSWTDIQWQPIEKRVFRLQLRIYKAAANQELTKLYKLQKLLIYSESAKLLSVRKVLEDKTGNKIPGVDHKIIFSDVEKFRLAKQLTLDGKSSSIRRTYILKTDGRKCRLNIPTMKDRAKQMLAYLAICPQWEAQFELTSYGFRPRKSVLDAIEQVFLGISKTSQWLLDANISKCFDQINHDYLLEKCHTFPEMRKQLRAWLKVGILEGDDFAFPEMGTPHGGAISPLLANIALEGLQKRLDSYNNNKKDDSITNQQSLTFVRYVDNFILLHPEKDVLENLKRVTEQFLETIGLKLNSTKNRIIHTSESMKGFRFVGFSVRQRRRWVKMWQPYSERESKQTFITLITPSKEAIDRHKQKIRDLIRRYRGASQEKLIQKLNHIIYGWTFSNHRQTFSRIFQALNQYLFIHLWKWARKRHPKMSKIKLKEKYWHQSGRRNWVFGIKYKNVIRMQLQLHSKILI